MKKIQAVRYTNGKVDDVAISCTLFRLEQMDDDVWWASANRAGKRTAFWIMRKGNRIEVTVQEDEIGCRDDSVNYMEEPKTLTVDNQPHT